MKVALLSMRWCPDGGWKTYKYHMSVGLQLAGVDVDCLSLEPPTKHHDWVRKLEDWDELEKYDIVHVDVLPASSFRKQPPTNCYDHLKQFPCLVVLHSPPEIKVPGLLHYLSTATNYATVVIRPALLRMDGNNAMRGLRYIPHPYLCWNRFPPKKFGKRVICTSRVMSHKNTDIILGAGNVEQWANYIDRPYNWHTLKPMGLDVYSHPMYKGGFDRVEDVYPGACALADMTLFARDGGGTQYTFLEAMDYGLGLILHKDWNTGRDDDELRPGVHYMEAFDAETLRAAANQMLEHWDRPLFTDHHEDVLMAHNAEDIAKLYIQAYDDVLAGRHTVKGIRGLL